MGLKLIVLFFYRIDILFKRKYYLWNRKLVTNDLKGQTHQRNTKVSSEVLKRN